ncbi:S-adenosyl-L-methionine-dependent methyltransferase [Rhypophila sp. PSN 637]
MLLARSNAHVRNLSFSPTRGRITQWRSIATVLPSSLLVAKTDVAKQLLETGIVQTRRDVSKNKQVKLPPRTDRTRVNLVDERLCDDILAYHGDSLRRHEGCDIIDLFPGAGVWSTKLHDFLKPRSHLLLDPDGNKVYKPFLAPLLQRPGTRLLEKSGIEWEHLSQFLNPEFLPHQVEQSDQYPPIRNDTLLITANLSWSPAKRFQSFPSVTQLLLYQFVTSVQSASWFQRYGLVRMLIWMCDDEKLSLIPRTIQGRRRLALSADLYTERLVEVAGGNTPVNHKHRRDEHMDIESAQNTVERMQKQGFVVPKGRESALYLDALSRKDKVVAGQQPPVSESLSEGSRERLRTELEAAHTADPHISHVTLKAKISRVNHYLNLRDKSAINIMNYRDEMVKILRQYQDATDDAGRAAALKRAEELETTLKNMKNNGTKNWFPYRDNLHTFRQSPPILHWDRRPFEPLQVKAEEFFPNVPCALVDMQPKAPHPLIFRNGTDRKAGMPDVWEIILQHLWSGPSVTEALKKIHFGAKDDILPKCPSLRDLDQHGSPINTPFFDIAGRSLNEKQLYEILEAWVESPFTPDLYGMLRAGYGSGLGSDSDTIGGDVMGNTTGRMSVKNLR